MIENIVTLMIGFALGEVVGRMLLSTAMIGFMRLRTRKLRKTFEQTGEERHASKEQFEAAIAAFRERFAPHADTDPDDTLVR